MIKEGIIENGLEYIKTILENHTIIELEYHNHYSITLDKTSILANGIDSLTATIEKKNYLNEIQLIDELVMLDIEGQQIEIELIQGIGQIEIVSDSVGTKVIKTIMEGVRNGEQTFKAI